MCRQTGRAWLGGGLPVCSGEFWVQNGSDGSKAWARTKLMLSRSWWYITYCNFLRNEFEDPVWLRTRKKHSFSLAASSVSTPFSSTSLTTSPINYIQGCWSNVTCVKDRSLNTTPSFVGFHVAVEWTPSTWWIGRTVASSDHEPRSSLIEDIYRHTGGWCVLTAISWVEARKMGFSTWTYMDAKTKRVSFMSHENWLRHSDQRFLNTSDSVFDALHKAVSWGGWSEKLVQIYQTFCSHP